jgi:hypothetical protein
VSRRPSFEFPTFCHISEYGENGYGDLHRLLAISQPLNLWAPSSVLIKQVSSISERDFIRYVDKRFIRVIARHEWLTDPGFRNAHPWPGARWVKKIDDALLDILRDDECVEEGQRRVLVAPPERGLDLAEEFLENNPDQVAYWNRASRSRIRKLPEGVLETAQKRAGGVPREVAKWILRDAYNHGAALALSRAETPLFLSGEHKRFVQLISAAQPSSGAQPPAPAPPSSRLTQELSNQLLDVLRHLDVHAGPRDLDRFLLGAGRQGLVEWMGDMCALYRDHNPRALDSAVIRQLRGKISGGRLSRPIGDLRAHPASTVMGAVGLAQAAVDTIVSPGSSWGMVGLAAAVYPVGHGLMRQMGWVPSTFTGPQWPFLYAYSSPATKRRMAKMSYALSVHGTP